VVWDEARSMRSLLNSGFLDLVINMQKELCFSMLKMDKCYILIRFAAFSVKIHEKPKQTPFLLCYKCSVFRVLESMQSY
jgi:hypothetical protein